MPSIVQANRSYIHGNINSHLVFMNVFSSLQVNSALVRPHTACSSPSAEKRGEARQQKFRPGIPLPTHVFQQKLEVLEQCRQHATIQVHYQDGFQEGRRP